MPNWITASRSTTMNGATSANSTAVCPCSEEMRWRRRVIVSVRTRRSGSEGASEDVRNGAELAGDGERQSAERGDDADGDHGQDDAVLGHRLTLLALSCCADEVVPVAKTHGSFGSLGETGWRAGPMRRGARSRKSCLRACFRARS